MNIFIFFNSRAYSALLFLVLISMPALTYSKTNGIISSIEPDHHFTVIVHYKQARPGDTLTLAIQNPLFNTGRVGATDWDWGSQNVIERNGEFTFKVKTPYRFGYVDILKTRTFSDRGGGFNKMRLAEGLFWEGGDSVIIELSNKETYTGIYSQFKFSGKGATKYTVQNQIDTTWIPEDSLEGFDQDFNYRNPMLPNIEKKMKILNAAKGLISPESYAALEADIYSINSQAIDDVRAFYDKSIRSSDKMTKEKFTAAYSKQFSNLNPMNIPPDILNISNSYLRMLYNKFKTDFYIYSGGLSSTDWGQQENDTSNKMLSTDFIYNDIKKSTTGTLRERLVIYFLIDTRRSMDINNIIQDARSYFKNAENIHYLSVLEGMSEHHLIPDGIFETTSGKEVKISNYRGKVVLIDFWFNGCGSCRYFYKNITSKIGKEYKLNRNFIMLSVNVDRSRKRWQEVIKGQYTDSNAINVYTQGLGTNHPFILKNHIPYYPYPILIDKNGVIRAVNNFSLLNLTSLEQKINKLLSE